MVVYVTTAELVQAASSAVPRQRPAGPPIVALVCSAGGLKALISVLSPLPASFPAAVIALQHHSPELPSYLAGILARNCALSVAVARPEAVLRAGTVLVVPPGKHALVTVGDRLALISADHSLPYRPSADLLLTSLALVAPRRTIGVILSGLGSDGAAGAVAVHDFGGLVIAADKASSAYFGMAEAAIARDGAVDHVLPVGEIPALLISLTRPTRRRTTVGAPGRNTAPVTASLLW
jgi:two-component system, chemotaxis family, protein-glutamate methylesterase/glutaminase